MKEQLKHTLMHLEKIFTLSINYPPKIIDKLLIRFHIIPLKYRIKYYKYYRIYINKKIKDDIYKTIKYVEHTPTCSKKINDGPIWVFWWQGEKNIPIVVKECIESIKRYSNKHKVIFINKYNIKKYATIPDYIYIKLYHHNMSLTHFSDILRFNLLYNHGGLWIDSTVYCTADLSKKYFSNIYTSGGYDFRQSLKLFASKWTEFLIGGNKGNNLFKFMNAFFFIYWKNHKYLIDYLLVDSALIYAYKLNIGGFKTYVDNEAWKNNPNMYWLVAHLNCKFNYNDYESVISNTNLFKLTYKKKFNLKKDTYYYKLTHHEL